MRLIALVHRWAGGLIGVLLAAIGLTGAILAWKDWWIALPGAEAVGARSSATLGAVTTRILTDTRDAPTYILFPDERFGLFRAQWGEASGQYLNDSGQVAAAWDSPWDRPELWLFDLHHQLLAGDTGEKAAGILALIGLGFIVTGAVLWWRTRRTFTFRLWPKRMTRSAVVRQHRDLGIVIAPVLFLSCLTGAMLALKPVASLLLTPLTPPAAMAAAQAAPRGDFGPLAPGFDWPGFYAAAQARFPDAELRLLILPRRTGEPIALRLRRAAEWLPNGRTMVWADPASGTIVATRDALTLPLGARVFNSLYPLHAGEVGGTLWRTAITLAGLALTLLGTLATWSFWWGARRPATLPTPERITAAG